MPPLSAHQLVLYQGSQVVLGQITVSVVRAWSRRLKAKNERLLKEYASSAGSADALPEHERTLVREELGLGKGPALEDTPRANAFEKGVERAVEAGERKL